MFSLFAIVLVIAVAYHLRTTKKYKFKNKVNNSYLGALIYLQICVITGGSSGLGKAVALQLLKKGANIYIVARNKEQLKETVESLTSEKTSEDQTIEAISADVTDFQSIKAAIKEIEVKYGKIDVLFSCAGN
jgi:NAD(P)-dependent dehydrogenase (short-subunit alcohol dehydrogenase family)